MAGTPRHDNFEGIAKVYDLSGIVPLSVQDFDASQIQVYPNPTNGLLQIESLDRTVSNIKLYNNLGQLVYELDNPQNSIDLSGYATGVYLFKITTLDTNTSIKKELLK